MFLWKCCLGYQILSEEYSPGFYRGFLFNIPPSFCKIGHFRVGCKEFILLRKEI